MAGLPRLCACCLAFPASFGAGLLCNSDGTRQGKTQRHPGPGKQHGLGSHEILRSGTKVPTSRRLLTVHCPWPVPADLADDVPLRYRFQSDITGIRIVNGERATIQVAGQCEAEKRGLLARLCAARNAAPGRRQYRSDSLSGIVPCRLISVIHRSYGAGPDTTKLVGANFISTASI